MKTKGKNARNKGIYFAGLEGIPLSGKTTLFRALKRLFSSQCSFSKEIYFTPKIWSSLKDMRGNLDTSFWFLQKEVERNRRFAKNKSKSIVIADRTYLSTLAYAYARSRIQKKPKEFELLLKNFYSVKNDLPNYKYILIFENVIKKSMSRRENSHLKENEYWMNKEFMYYYREFYRNEAKKYTNAEIEIVPSHKYPLKKLIAHTSFSIARKLGLLKLSVVVCHWNDKEGLFTTLHSLEKQSLNEHYFEVVIVDNNPPFKIEEKVRMYRKVSNLNIFYVKTPRVGLSSARNTGVKNASSEVIFLPIQMWRLTEIASPS